MLFRDRLNNTTLRHLSAPLPMIVSLNEKRFQLWSRTNLTGEILAANEEDRTPTVSREQAGYLVHEFIRGRPELADYQIAEIKDLAEIEARGPRPYGVPSEELSDSWIAYLKDPRERMGLHSAAIVILSKVTGLVLYLGSAYDES